MRRYEEHRDRLQAQGVAAEAHRTRAERQRGGGGRGRGRGRASRRAERRQQRQREVAEELPSPAPAPAAPKQAWAEPSEEAAEEETVTAAVLSQRWAAIATAQDVLPFYTEHGSHGVFRQDSSIDKDFC